MTEPRPRVFISSVMQGYEAIRDATARGIRRGGGQPVRAEDFSASSPSPRTACLDGVASSDGLALILGGRYGFTTPAGVSITQAEYEEGVLRETPASLHSHLGTTSEILRKHGPGVAGRQVEEDLVMGERGRSFGYLAVAILNAILRPVLAKWHPVLLDYESSRGTGVSPSKHEQRWARGVELRRVLNGVRRTLIAYAAILEEVVGSCHSSSAGTTGRLRWRQDRRR